MPNGDFLSSKTMRLIVLTMALILLVFVFTAALSALGVHVPYVGETLAALTGNAGLGTARNVWSDGPMRRNGYPPALGP